MIAPARQEGAKFATGLTPWAGTLPDHLFGVRACGCRDIDTTQHSGQFVDALIGIQISDLGAAGLPVR